MLFDAIILTCCSRFQGGRSVSAIYHLLKGKRAIQTVQDARLYQLEQFYGIHPTLRKQDLDQLVSKLNMGDYLKLTNESTALPMEKGRQWVKEHIDELPVNCFNGLLYSRSAPIFQERLLLLIQTLTNSRMQNMTFIPVVDNPIVTEWVKRTFYMYRNEQESFLNNLYAELHLMLTHFKEWEASMFTDSLTGYQHYGWSSFQVSEVYGVNKQDVPLYKTAIVHRMMAIAKEKQVMFPLLAQFLRELPNESKLSKSAKKTKILLDNHFTAENIADYRNLKLNTIYDHLVEIALYDHNFPFSMYVNLAEQMEIKKAMQTTLTYKLKDIKEAVDDSISYFQIRLVLAMERLPQ
ncbi:helix-turn-helix domain-containing protein [Lentibacillus halophilus]|uniref:Helix-turn-helix domain-containing protein n=1 Tax=Lentibacillus halophilus TaxID=295065 RepID=A0ABP3J6T6_9BACI